MARFLYSKQCLGLNLSVTIDGRGGCTLFRVLQEIKHWHARLVFGTHTHTRTSGHILPHLSAWNLPHQVQHWTAAAILAELGTKSLASGHCAIASVCLSISQSYYVLFIFYLFLSLSIHVLERTSCSILYFCQFHRTCPPRAMTSA